MQVSYTLQHAKGHFYFTDRAREWLQTPRDCRLHGRVINDGRRDADAAVVLSPIPCEFWTCCYRVTITSSGRTGSLAAAMEAIAEQKLIIHRLVASAASTSGEMCITAFVTPIDACDRELNEPRRKGLEDALNQGLAKQSRLSNSRLLASGGLRSVRVTPLLVLRALALLTPEAESALAQKLGTGFEPTFSVNIIDGEMSLDTIRLGGEEGPSVFECLCARNEDLRSKSMGALVIIDTEENYYRIGLLEPHPFYSIKVPLSVSAATAEGLVDVGRPVIDKLSSGRDPANFFHATTTVISCETPQTRAAGQGGSGAQFREDFELHLIADLSLAMGDTHAEMIERLRRKIESVIGQKEDRTIRYRSGSDDQTGRATFRPLLGPLVFTATNAKPELEPKYREMATRLWRALKSEGLRPVFLDWLGGEANLNPQMTSILELCPMLVSLFLPDPRYVLQNVGTRGRQRRAGEPPQYIPSPWTVFEESYMLSLTPRPVFRMAHEHVKVPPQISRDSTLSFNDDPSEFDRQVGTLLSRIRAHMQTGEYRATAHKCADKLVLSGFDKGRIHLIDPEAWLNGYA